MFALIVRVLRISADRQLGSARDASEIESENLDAEIILAGNIFFARIELLAPVQPLAARGASDGHGKHHTHFELAILGALCSDKLRRIWGEKRREMRTVNE